MVTASYVQSTDVASDLRRNADEHDMFVAEQDGDHIMLGGHIVRVMATRLKLVYTG